MSMRTVEVKAVDPTEVDLRYLDGPWRNDACKGYAAMAMRRAGLDHKIIQKVSKAMELCFDDTTVEEAAEYYRKGDMT